MVGDLVTCCYGDLPQNWNPFIEGRPAIVLEVKVVNAKIENRRERVFYRVAISHVNGEISKKLLKEDNLKPYYPSSIKK